MQFTDTSEKGFQKFIVNYLTDKTMDIGLLKLHPAEFDREFCINIKQVLAFIEATQKDAYEMLQKKGERSFLVRLDEKIKELGVIEVLRKGVKHFDKTIDLFYRKPSSSTYNAQRCVKICSQIYFQ